MAMDAIKASARRMPWDKASESIKSAARSEMAGISVNRFVLASTLGSKYRPPADPELLKALFALNRELTAQGNNLNQIARQLNAGLIGMTTAVVSLLA